MTDDMSVPQVNDTLVAFPSDAALRRWVEDHAEAERIRRAAIAEACRAEPDTCEEDEVIVTGSRISSGPNITNVQNAGVDEGDIAKQIGDHLVFLQDGRLFSVSLAGASPTLVDRIDVYDDPQENVWIDELLVSDRTLVVTGYHYGKKATEISIFRLDSIGRLRPAGQWYVGSDDYYNHDNSATRLIGQTLVFHMPLDLDQDMRWPVLKAAGSRSETRLIDAQDIVAPLQPLRWPTLHAVMACDLRPTARGRAPTCTSRGVVASGRAEWIVSGTDGFLWTEPQLGVDACDQRPTPATLFRFPHGQDTVEAVFVRARISDRFSVEAREDRLYALTEPLKTRCAPDTNGFGVGHKGPSLLDLPLDAFSERPVEVSPTYSTNLPHDMDRDMPGVRYGRLKARFTSDALIYARSRGWRIQGEKRSTVATVVDLASPTRWTTLDIPHAVQRIERMGENAVVIGPAPLEDEIPSRVEAATVSVSWLDLAPIPVLADTLDLPRRRESEGRAQALNMRVEADGGALIGLPTVASDVSYDRDEETATDITFMQADMTGQLDEMGIVQGDPTRMDPAYRCETSCVDWYGNARPFFIGDRIFALIASELIEVDLQGGAIVERARLNLTGPVY